MSRIACWVCCILLLCHLESGRAEFVGDLVLVPAGCEKKGACTLGREFAFIDSHRVGWVAREGLPTDGATIPAWAQPMIGTSFDSAFIKSAVIHDHYCDRHVRPWRQTHRVFYEALRESGVSKNEAGVMYFAVLLGGPKWIKLIKGRPCALGYQCINSMAVARSAGDAKVVKGENDEVLLVRPNTYETAGFKNVLADHLGILEGSAEQLDVETVERLASIAMAGDLYFSNGEAIGGDPENLLPTK